MTPYRARLLIDSLLLAPPQPHRKQMTSPRRETPTSNRVASNTIADEPFIPEVMGSTESARHDGTREQCVAGPSLRKCRTRIQLEARDALLTLSEPFSICRAAAELGWDYSEARHWISELSARGYLVASRDGHRWSDAARRVG